MHGGITTNINNMNWISWDYNLLKYLATIYTLGLVGPMHINNETCLQ